MLRASGCLESLTAAEVSLMAWTHPSVCFHVNGLFLNWLFSFGSQQRAAYLSSQIQIKLTERIRALQRLLVDFRRQVTTHTHTHTGILNVITGAFLDLTAVLFLLIPHHSSPETVSCCRRWALCLSMFHSKQRLCWGRKKKACWLCGRGARCVTSWPTACHAFWVCCSTPRCWVSRNLGVSAERQKANQSFRNDAFQLCVHD